jgi:predicted metal-dependent HD superfamily phosphohydrolase
MKLSDGSIVDRQIMLIKWHECWVDRVIDREAGDRIFERLATNYSHPDRYYHNLTHIDRVLADIDRLTLDRERLFSLNMAAWFHDFIYDTRANDNEAQSAIAAADLLATVGVSDAEISDISNLILATRNHDRTVALDRHTQIFLDADLAILGSSPEVYLDYSLAIRQEYQWVAAAAYREGRTKVLAKFLESDRIYHTDLFYREKEAIARTNLSAEIATLNAS